MADFLGAWLDTHGINVVVISHCLRGAEVTRRHGLREMCGCEDDNCGNRTRDRDFKRKQAEAKRITREIMIRLLGKLREKMKVSMKEIDPFVTSVRLMRGGNERKSPPCKRGGEAERAALQHAKTVKTGGGRQQEQERQEGRQYIDRKWGNWGANADDESERLSRGGGGDPDREPHQLKRGEQEGIRKVQEVEEGNPYRVPRQYRSKRRSRQKTTGRVSK